ncbi:PI-PLC X domain-containing protein 3 [Trichoplax sp. H2]|uniref:Phosphatidylinositol-specific phospholipase C X domain-containing protein n=1 Tax=Trichoplax adhaerens TaxID=10228 RepID=B3RZ97_TRIAD|nr:hypothetical protein TRIADDRAFT_57375 [Trichoplax adhaerens]EDV23804.1 hypothetical protein TRIADDRAFT_57375 [Trichoplax adhaerens]RDD42418.1 PI-PLC X domain-containing protein 3 [Trichoplax sp. H2]|eukprot:XP_002113330.1 hypothetical protein TRIADDRAFT_57375 [Trichoplax adhaerens]
MNSKINPSVLQAKVREMDASVQKNIKRLHTKPKLKVLKQKWTKPHNRTFLVIQWDIEAQPGEYDYVAVFDKDPLSPLDYIPYQFYWVNRESNKTVITDVVLKENTSYFVAYYTYLRDPIDLDHCDFTPLEIATVHINIEELSAQDDGLGYSIQPHPRIAPQEINMEQTKEALTADLDDGGYQPHDPFLTASGQFTLDSGLDLNLTFDLNWFHPDKVSMWDYVAIFDHYPEDADDFIANQWCWVSNHHNGCYSTTVNFDRSRDYYVGYMIYDFTEKKFVIKEVTKYYTRSNWMTDLKDSIGNVRIKDLTIPGTHNSACYNMTVPLADALTQSQSETFEQQLFDGIRYFDLHVEYYGKYEDKFWFTHHEWSTEVSVSHFLNLIKNFITNNQEIVMLDFNQFYYFNHPSAHDELIELIIKHLGDDMALVSYSQDVTVGKLWEENKRVIVAYDGKLQSENYRNENRLWPTIQTEWDSVETLDDVKKNLDQEINQRHHGIWLLQGIFKLTEESKVSRNIQDLANIINPNLSRWMDDDWIHKNINVIVSDFYLGNNIISMAIERNLARGRAAQYSDV